MSTTQSPTPRTDMEFAHFPTEGPNVAHRIESARESHAKLERELAEAQALHHVDLWFSGRATNPKDAVAIALTRIAQLTKETT